MTENSFRFSDPSCFNFERKEEEKSPSHPLEETTLPKSPPQKRRKKVSRENHQMVCGAYQSDYDRYFLKYLLSPDECFEEKRRGFVTSENDPLYTYMYEPNGLSEARYMEADDEVMKEILGDLDFIH